MEKENYLFPVQKCMKLNKYFISCISCTPQLAVVWIFMSSKNKLLSQ